MNDIIPFLFDGEKLVRAVLVDGKPHFIGKDVADRLGYADTADAIKRHCKGPVKRLPLSTPGGTQKVRVLAMADVLRLIVGSTLPEAVRFEKWVFEDVLPSILRTGSYTMPVPDPGPIPPRPYDLWTLEERRAAVAEVNAARKTYNQGVAVWMWKRVGMPIPPEHLLPEWCRQPDLFGNGLTITVKPNAA